MRILVAGGAGYIGSILVSALLQRGWHVTVLDSFAAGAPYLATCCADPNFEAVRGDARDMATMAPLLAQTDWPGSTARATSRAWARATTT